MSKNVKVIIGIIILIIVVWLTMFSVDYTRVSNFKEPIFVIKKEILKDGGNYKGYGLGYKVEVEKNMTTEQGIYLKRLEMYMFNKIIVGAITNINETKKGEEDVNITFEQASGEVNLNKIELKEIEDFLNKEENNGFIKSTYNNAKEVDLYYVFSTKEYFADGEETKKYENYSGSVITSPLYKVTQEQVNDVLTNKFGIEGIDNDFNYGDNFEYIEQEDSYYFINCDDLYIESNCTKGTKTNNIYVVNYESKATTGNQIKGTVTLMKQDNVNNWFFVSNKVETTNLY